MSDRPEPKVRKDGTCRVCRKPRRTDRQKGVPEQAYLSDPFCSSKCAREYWGTQLAVNLEGHPPKYPAKALRS